MKKYLMVFSEVTRPHRFLSYFSFALLVLIMMFIGCFSRPLPDVGIRKGSQIVQKELFYDLGNESVSAIIPGKFTKKLKSDLLINSSACGDIDCTLYLRFFSHDGSLRTSVNLGDLEVVGIRPVDINKNGVYNYYATTCNGTVVFLDNKGKVLWRFSPLGEKNRENSIVGDGDFDGDGKVELVVVTTNRKDLFIYILDEKGGIKSQFVLKDSNYNNFSYMKIIDVDVDGRAEIVYFGRNSVEIINYKGEPIRRFKAPWECWCLNIWPIASDKPLLYGWTLGDVNNLIIADTYGNVVEKRPIDPFARIEKIIPVNFLGPKEKPYYVATRFWAYTYDRSAVYILDPAGKIIYEEIMPRRVHNIEVIHDQRTKKDYVLFSVLNKVWRFKLK
jgi:hypothetical protein